MSLAALEAARAGDEAAFTEIVEPFRRELHVHCYRMLGSIDDADDLLQEVWLAAWRGIADFAGRSSVRSWLYAIATRRCLNAIRDGRRRPPPAPQPPFEPPEPSRQLEATWLQPYPDRLLDQDPAIRAQQQETITLAFIAMLQTMPPRQTSALVLVDVLGFGVTEAAAMLDVTPTVIKGLLQRARRRARDAAVDDHVRIDEEGLARRFAEAYSRDEVDAVIALLTDDAWLAMPPAPHLYQGLGAIADFLRASAGFRAERQLRLVPTRANGGPAFGCYLPDGDVARSTGIVVIEITGDRIGRITRFLDPLLHRRFDLPDVVRTSIGD